MAVLLVEWPADFLVEGFHGGFGFLGYVPHYRCDHFAFVEAFFAFEDIFVGDTAFGEIDVACVSSVFCSSKWPYVTGDGGVGWTFIFVNSKHNDDFVAADSDELLDTAYTPS